MRAATHEVMEPYAGRPDSTRLSLAVDLVVLACILVSCALVGVEHLYPEHSALLDVAEPCWSLRPCRS